MSAFLLLLTGRQAPSGGSPAPPAAPTVTLTPLSDPSYPALEYTVVWPGELEYQIDFGPYDGEYATFDAASETGGTSSSMVGGDLAYDTRYKMRARVRDTDVGDGPGPWSSFGYDDAWTPPAPPGVDFAGVNTGGFTAELDFGDGCTLVLFEYQADGAASWIDATGSYTPTSSTTGTIAIEGLTAETLYYARAKVVSGLSEEESSYGVGNVSTAAPEPEPEVVIAITAIQDTPPDRNLNLTVTHNGTGNPVEISWGATGGRFNSTNSSSVQWNASDEGGSPIATGTYTITCDVTINGNFFGTDSITIEWDAENNTLTEV